MIQNWSAFHLQTLKKKITEMHIFTGCPPSARTARENLLIEFSDKLKMFQYFMRTFADMIHDTQTCFRLLSSMGDSTETVTAG